MLIIVKCNDVRPNVELKELHKLLNDQLNADNKSNHSILVLPSDCTYDAINDYDSKNIQMIKED